MFSWITASSWSATFFCLKWAEVSHCNRIKRWQQWDLNVMTLNALTPSHHPSALPILLLNSPYLQQLSSPHSLLCPLFLLDCLFLLFVLLWLLSFIYFHWTWLFTFHVLSPLPVLDDALTTYASSRPLSLHHAPLSFTLFSNESNHF